MYEFLYQYLILNRQLYLPGIGVFTIENLPAALDIVHKQVHAPLSVIRFHNEAASAEKQFFHFLEQRLQTDELNAIRMFNDFLYNIKQQFEQQQHLHLPFIGTLKKAEQESIVFTPAYEIETYLPPVTAERIIRKNNEHTIRSGEEEFTRSEMEKKLKRNVSHQPAAWLWYALLLFILGLAAIAWHFYQNKS